MLRFFRNIRKKLIEQKNIRKYFWYALGEILLVMIGILLALQVNNWNEKRKLANERIAILDNLNVEFSENVLELKVSIAQLDSLKSSLGELLRVMHDQPDTLSVEEFEILLEGTFFTPSYSPSSFVLEELKNSGGLTRLDDQELESLLFDWERHNAEMRIVESDFSSYGSDYIEFLTEFGSVRNLDVIIGFIPTLRKSTITENSLEMLKNPVFENKAENFYFLAYRVSLKYSETVQKADRIIELTKN